MVKKPKLSLFISSVINKPYRTHFYKTLPWSLLANLGKLIQIFPKFQFSGQYLRPISRKLIPIFISRNFKFLVVSQTGFLENKSIFGKWLWWVFQSNQYGSCPPKFAYKGWRFPKTSRKKVPTKTEHWAFSIIWPNC